MKRGWYINLNYTLIDQVNSKFIVKSYGLDFFFFKKLEARLESHIFLSKNNITSLQWLIFIKYLYQIVPQNKSFKKRKLLNIYYLDIISSYRGWRHSKGLPVRGQRTWTNGWSVYKSNLTLREYRIEVSKRIYGSIQINYLSIAYLAAQINMLWKFQ
jgi:ribosomal protein S13